MHRLGRKERMNFKHPEEAMRCRILGRVPTCYLCAHRTSAWLQHHTTWCPKQPNDPLPHHGYQESQNNPGQCCPEFMLDLERLK
jgi:hypothetical protein